MRRELAIFSRKCLTSGDLRDCCCFGRVRAVAAGFCEVRRSDVQDGWHH